MVAERRKNSGLAARIVRVTLLVGVVTVLTASIVAISRESQNATAQIMARDRDSIEIVQGEVLTRFTSVESAASAVAENVAAIGNPTALNARLRPVFDSSDDVLEEIVVADTDGHVLTAFPGPKSSSPIGGTAFRDAVAGATGFRRVQAKDGTWAVWLTRTAPTPRGVSVVILIRARTDFLSQDLMQAAGGSKREVTVLESGRPLVSSNADDPGVYADAKWEPDPTSRFEGKVTAPSRDGRMVQGYYADVRGIEGIDWRVAVLEPSTLVMSDSIQAVAPTILVLMLGGLLGIAAALVVSRRLVGPLKRLEETAYRAANGSYVKPIPADTDDEIGQVADAFNAVALRLNALHDLSQLLASASQLDQVLDGILSAMRHIVGPGVAAIYLLDDEGEWLFPARARGIDVASVRRVPATGDGWLARSLRDTEVIVHSSDVPSMKTNLPGLSTDQTVALTAPLVSGHEALGVIVVLRRHHEPVSEAEREMVRTFSAQAAVAVHNSRLFEAATESLRIAEVLRTVAERLVRPGALSGALADIEAVVDHLFGTRATTFAIVDRAELGLPPAEDRDHERVLIAMARRLLAEPSTNATVVHFGDDAEADEVMRGLDAGALLITAVALESEHGAFLVVPLWRVQVGTRDKELALAVANEVALALDNAYLYERALSRANNLETVFRISQAVGSSLQVNVVLNRVLDVVQKILSADAVALMTYDPRKRAIVTAMARGAIPADFVTLEVNPGEDVPGYVFSTGEPAAFRDLDESMSGVAGAAARQNLRSMLAVPLLARGRSIGVLTVFSVDPGAFSDEDMSVLQTFASQASLALDTARLYSHEHEVASILQQSILPDELPEYAEIEAASVYQPAGAEAEIGGDYYDLFRAPDHSIWFAIADVCGKGVTAATKTSMIKYSVRAFVAAGMSPAVILREVNRAVSESGDTSDIVTLWVGRLVPETGELTYASGGHPPGVVKHTDGTFEKASPTGPLLGALADVVYGEETMQLGEGDVILLYTDGVTEARAGKEFFGEARVQEALAVGGSAEEIVRRLLTLVRRWVHGELRDDVALLAIALRQREGEHIRPAREEGAQ
jgi:serine phosphatase RsbU (regulator of sigma subunit)/HAMP domain-containing protein